MENVAQITIKFKQFADPDPQFKVSVHYTCYYTVGQIGKYLEDFGLLTSKEFDSRSELYHDKDIWLPGPSQMCPLEEEKNTGRTFKQCSQGSKWLPLEFDI